MGLPLTLAMLYMIHMIPPWIQPYVQNAPSAPSAPEPPKIHVESVIVSFPADTPDDFVRDCVEFVRVRGGEVGFVYGEWIPSFACLPEGGGRRRVECYQRGR
jgi:hypothetical protein